ncbi:MAG TPA: MBL fold metallo-hydrolase [Chitinophaga sp.]|uniref:MBL fold metallo-hydrolase n=1 Tax=Chitinophaga sp. TaxID=1869181 RepID=UPI002CA82C5B|nr:MBL fold metallo-hydrolase [Chitinophaga sp.]HVI43413.1 MBL fold metallo-hydrolase [Chitinophaga sp.]
MKREDSLQVTHLGGPTAILEVSGLRFMTDPTFDDAGTVYPVSPGLTVEKIADPVQKDTGKVDVILLSHDQHFDNFDHAGREFAGKADRVLTTVAGAARLKGNSTGLATWDSVTLAAPNGDEITVTSTPARHGPAGIEKISGDVTGFIITVKGKINYELYITGDTVYYDGVADVARRFDPNYIFAFAGAAQPRGPFHVTMDTNDVLDTSHVFPDAVIIPLHFEGWSHYTQGEEALSRSFNALGISHRLRILPLGTTEDLPV